MSDSKKPFDGAPHKTKAIIVKVMADILDNQGRTTTQQITQEQAIFEANMLPEVVTWLKGLGFTF